MICQMQRNFVQALSLLWDIDLYKMFNFLPPIVIWLHVQLAKYIRIKNYFSAINIILATLMHATESVKTVCTQNRKAWCTYGYPSYSSAVITCCIYNLKFNGWKNLYTKLGYIWTNRIFTIELRYLLLYLNHHA